VEVPGIEPGSFVVSSGLLRAQSATPLLGPTGHADEPV
jgi:site-specific DNA recombinase